MVKDEQLTPEALEQITALIKEKTNAFDMLAKNYKSGAECDLTSSAVVARLQAQYFALLRTQNVLKSPTLWNQNEYNEPNEVNFAIPAVVAGQYSSFALKDVREDYQINYPLDDDYASGSMPFAGTDIPASHLSMAYRQIEQKLGLTVSESAVIEKSEYKTKDGLLNKAVLKIKNAFLKLAKKPPLVASIFKGSMKLQTSVGGYNVSNVEKLVKVYDLILQKAILREVKAIKKSTKTKVSEQMQYVARLFAGVLMARVNDLGNVQNNQTAEKCLWLQFAGALNRYNFTGEELKQITSLAVKAVANTCADLGITKEKVIERMTMLGFTYTSVPTDIEQALLNVKEKDYTRYSEEVVIADTTAEPDLIVTSTDTDTIVRIVPEGVVTDDTTVTPTTEDTDDAVDTSLIEVGTDLIETETTAQNIKASTVEKSVDKLIVKFLASVTTTLADKIDSGKLKGKKLEKAKMQLNLYNLTLAYYVQSVNSKPMSVKGEEYTESEISRAKQIVKGLLQQKARVAQMVVESPIERLETQSSKSYINAVCKTNLNYTLRDYFLKLIKGCVDYCVEQQFGPKKTTTTADADFNDEILGLIGETPTYTDYVPDFVIVEDGPVQTPYKPNFIIVGEPAVVADDDKSK